MAPIDGQPEQPEQPIVEQDQISRVAIRIPPIWKQNIQIWFHQIECQFENCQIRNESTKYNYVISAIESDVLDRISDFFQNVPTVNRYTALKERLIHEFTDSEAKRTKKLLTEFDLGDQKPTTLLRQMRNLAGNKVTEDFLKTMFLDRLPAFVRQILSASDGSLAKIAEMADRIIETAPAGQIAPINHNPVESSLHAIEERFKALEIKIDQISTPHRSRGRYQGQLRFRSRSRSRSNGKFSTC